MQEDIIAFGNVVRSEPVADTGIVWSTVIGGALTMLAFSFLLFLLAAAFGLESMSPWHQHTEKTFAISGAIALIVVQWLSASLGGYLTGRLRTPWVGAHVHEVFFRDTVHGFLAWGLASIVGFVLIAGLAMHHPMMEQPMGGHDAMRGPMREDLHYLFRTAGPSQHELTPQDRDNAAYILDKAVATGKLNGDDKSYLVQLVTQQTDVSADEADIRINGAVSRDQVMVDEVRKVTARSSLFLFFSMLIAAFVASVAAALGGGHRDLHYSTGSLVEPSA